MPATFWHKVAKWMFQKWRQLLMDWPENALPVLVVSAAGGLARVFYNYINGTKTSVMIALLSAFVAAFSGFMCVELLRTTGLVGDKLFFCAGVGGWLGPELMKVLAKMVLRIAETPKE